MVDGTCLKTMEESIKWNEAQIVEIQEFMISTRSFMDDSRKQQSDICKRQDEFKRQADDHMKMIENLTEMVRILLPKDLGANRAGATQFGANPVAQGVLGIPNEADRLFGAGRPTRVRENGSSANRRPETLQEQGGRQSIGVNNSRIGGNRLPKIDFPSFEGSNPRSWICKCERYFSFFAVQESHKVELAAMYVNGRADVWLHGLFLQDRLSSWEELKATTLMRFGNEHGSDVVGEFNKLQQEEDLEAYTEQIEELRTSMLIQNPQLPDSYFVSSFVSGLRKEIQPLVKVGKPVTLAEAIELA